MTLMFYWFRNRKRKKIIATPTPIRWREYFDRLWFVHHLTREQGKRLIDSTKVLVAEKNWEGCAGLELTEEMRVMIAAQVAWLVLGHPGEYFDQTQSILVYPNVYVSPRKIPLPGGLILEQQQTLAGQAWYRGPVIVTWEEALAGATGPNGGHNVVLHEFAHQLDMRNGSLVDGIPPIESAKQAKRFVEVTRLHFEWLIQQCQQGQPTLLDCYGATDPAEFFAVATEVFFQLPDTMQQFHPDLYEVLAEYYLQTPTRHVE
jgi:MtfA peptidase